MSPDTYFYNDEDLARQVIVQDIRHNYGFIFSQITQLFQFYDPDYNKKLSKRAEDIEARIQILHMEEHISEYLYVNFFSVYKQYETMLPGNLAKERKAIGADKQNERLKNLKDLLTIYIGDLSDEISDVIKQQIESDKRSFIKQYFN